MSEALGSVSSVEERREKGTERDLPYEHALIGLRDNSTIERVTANSAPAVHRTFLRARGTHRQQGFSCSQKAYGSAGERSWILRQKRQDFRPCGWVWLVSDQEAVFRGAMAAQGLRFEDSLKRLPRLCPQSHLCIWEGL